MSLPQMLADLPRACDVGTKRNANLLLSVVNHHAALANSPLTACCQMWA